MRTSLVVALLGVAAGACAYHQVVLTVQAPATFGLEPGGFELAEVVRVVDGDTIVVRIQSRSDGPAAGSAAPGREEPVRLIGIDTPESVRPGTPVECFGREASAAAKALLEGGTVRLVKDIEERDDFGRLLRYVYFGDEMANGRLVANGYAYAYTYPPNVRHSKLFLQLQQAARESGRGLWAPGTCRGER